MSSRLVLLVDMDGPLADFDVAFFSMCDFRGFAMDATVHTQQHRFATDHILDPADRRAARAYVDGPGWFADLPVVPGARAGLEEMAEYADVWICTKPLESSPTCRDEKAAWVCEHLGSRWLSRLIIAPDKSLVRGSILWDDAPRLEWIDRAEWASVIYPTTWNRAGSQWEHLPAWRWGDPIERLLAHGV